MSVIGTHLREAGQGFADVARNPGLRKVNLALVGSVVGDWAYGIAVSIWAYQQGGATALGIFGVVRLITLAVLTPFAAAFADRYPRRAVMITSDLVRVVLVVAGAALVASDGPHLTVYGLALVTSVVGAAFRPAQASLIPSLANDAEELTGANVVASTIESLGFFIGPAVAGFLLIVTDLPVVYLFNAGTFLLSALILLGLPRPPVDPAVVEQITGGVSALAGSSVDDPSWPGLTVDGGATDLTIDDVVDASSDQEEGFLAEVTAGFRTIVAHPQLRLVIAIYTAQTLVAGASLIYEVAIVFELLEMGESGLGLVNSVLGIGGIVGGFIAMMLARRQRIAMNFGAGVILWAAPLLLIVARPSLATTLAAMLLIGIANSLVDVSAYTIIQRIAPQAVMGRVFGALDTLLIFSMAVGTLAMTVMVAQFGVRYGLAVIGIGVTAVGLAALPALIRMDTRVLAPPGLALLRGVPMLSVLPEPILERLARSLVSLTVPAGSDVFRAGDRGDRYWVIETGRVSITQNGRVVGELGSGEGFGEIALLRDVPRTATVTAMEDVVLKGLDSEHFVPAVTGDGQSIALADAVVNRLLTLA